MELNVNLAAFYHLFQSAQAQVVDVREPGTVNNQSCLFGSCSMSFMTTLSVYAVVFYSFNTAAAGDTPLSVGGCGIII